MKRITLAGYAIAGGLALGLGSLAMVDVTGVRSLITEEIQQLNQDAKQMERGIVKSMLKNDHNDVDGLRLDSGINVHFPPHMDDRILKYVKVGDSVKVEGRHEVTLRGEKVFEISRLVSGDSTVQIDHPRPPKPHPRHGKGPRNEQPMNSRSEVSEYASNPHGDIDGLILKDRTVVKFSPHQSDELRQLVKALSQQTQCPRRHKGDRDRTNEWQIIHLRCDPDLV